MEERLKALSEERSTFYGDPRISHKAIGLAWEALIRNRYHFLDSVLPAPGSFLTEDLVALMMSAFKEVRAARPMFKRDSYDDGHVYLGYSEQFRQEYDDGSKAATTEEVHEQGGEARLPAPAPGAAPLTTPADGGDRGTEPAGPGLLGSLSHPKDCQCLICHARRAARK